MVNKCKLVIELFALRVKDLKQLAKYYRIPKYGRLKKHDLVVKLSKHPEMIKDSIKMFAL